MAIDFEKTIQSFKDYQARARHILDNIGNNPSQHHKIEKLEEILEECRSSIDLYAMLYSEDQLHPGKFI